MKFKKIIKIIFKIILFLILAVVLYFGGIIIYDTTTDYQPKSKEKLEVEGKGYFDHANDSMFTLLSWNIGYCGLGKEMDFFYDGGSKVRPTKEDFQKYLNGVLNKLTEFDTVDIIMLQEVDTSAKRTYYTNETDLIKQFMPIYSYVFAKNYDVQFVPLPVLNPMGSVISGMITLSKIKPCEAFRYPYYANYSWPMGVMMLDRCLIYTKFKIPGDKYLVVLNTHNSAFDDAAELREVEGFIMKSIMLDEYAKGNYVIVGGDWNRNPPLFDGTKFTDKNISCTVVPAIDTSFLPQGWQWVYDASLPTNRNVNEAYVKGTTKTTIIDYFAVSPNLDVIENKTISDDFEFSDHQPIFLRVKMKADTMADDTIIPKEEFQKLSEPKWKRKKY
jgi:endonuclease/exonuclease/phosphatase family metal-dependent hydrolase